MVFHLGVQSKPFLIFVKVVKNGCQTVVSLGIAWQILDDDILQLTQLRGHLAVMLRESVNIIVAYVFLSKQLVHVREHRLFLILHV